MELLVGKTQEQSLCVSIYTRFDRKHVWNKLQTYCDDRFNLVVHFYTPSADGKHATLTAIVLFHNNISPSGEQPEHRKLAHE